LLRSFVVQYVVHQSVGFGPWTFPLGDLGAIGRVAQTLPAEPKLQRRLVALSPIPTLLSTHLLNYFSGLLIMRGDLIIEQQRRKGTREARLASILDNSPALQRWGHESKRYPRVRVRDDRDETQKYRNGLTQDFGVASDGRTTRRRCPQIWAEQLPAIPYEFV
jgi:hypothetical protein